MLHEELHTVERPISKVRLNVEDVKTIRQALAAGTTVNDLSKHYGVNASTIRRIRSFKAWKQVG